MLHDCTWVIHMVDSKPTRLLTPLILNPKSWAFAIPRKKTYHIFSSVDSVLLHGDSFTAILYFSKSQFFSLPSLLSFEDSLFYHNRSNQKIMPSSSPTQFTNLSELQLYKPCLATSYRNGKRTAQCPGSKSNSGRFLENVDYSSVSQSVMCRPKASASPGKLLQTQIPILLN